MTVTKQQQLEWMAKEFSEWPGFGFIPIRMSHSEIGSVELAFNEYHKITKQEWQQARDKMHKQDNSLSKRGPFPPIGEQAELWFGGSFAYNCEFICMRGMNYIVWNLDADRPDCADIMNSEFRQLRTEREKAIDELNELVGDIEKYPTWRDAIAGIIDAGYRKDKTK